MATTTTNFGWDIPQSTDLVKDGATAIAALGQDIDTAMVDLKGGTTGQVLAKASGTDLDFSWVAQDDSNAIQNAIVDAKGDLIGATANDTPARLAVGTNGQVLTADSTAATGLAWATPASGGMTLLASGSLSGSQTSITTLSGSYKELVCYVISPTSAAADNLAVRLNNDSGSNYGWTGTTSLRTSTQQNTGATWVVIDFPVLVASGATQGYEIRIPNYTAGNYKSLRIVGAGVNSGTKYCINWLGMWASTSAVTEIDLLPASGTFSGGTYEVYGVK